MLPLPAPNPFGSDVLTDARHDPTSDVRAIHADAYDACWRAVSQAREGSQSGSVLLNGEPGSGKTHLLARLRVALEKELISDASKLSLFVYVRLNTHPDRLWRHLREQMVADLRRVIGYQSILERVLLLHVHRLHAIEQPVQESILGADESFADDLAESLDEIVDNRNLAIVLTQLALRRHKLNAWGWLRGESLPEHALSRLGVNVLDLDGDEQPENRAREIVLALTRLLHPYPIVICFDQIEALEVDDDKKAGFTAYGRLGATLHDEAHHLALISCIQTSELMSLLDGIRGADRDRLFRTQAEMTPLQQQEAQALVQYRLDAVPELAAMRLRQKASLWPLDVKEIVKLTETCSCTPRQLITYCRNSYDRLHDSPPAQETSEQYIERSWDERLIEVLQDGTKANADGILHTGLQDAVHAVSSGWQQEASSNKDVDLCIEKAKHRIEISICNQSNMRSLQARLGRLNKRLDTGSGDLVVLRHSALAVSPTAVRTKEAFDELMNKGARFLQPSEEVSAALEVLRAMLAEAHAGELHCNGEAISPSTIKTWISEHMPPELREFVLCILGEAADAKAPEDFWLLQALLDHVDSVMITSLDDVTRVVDAPKADIIACIHKAFDQLRIIEGNPEIIYRYVPAEASTQD